MAGPLGHTQIVYNDFTGGERGEIAARYAARNQFHAVNMLVYRDGTLGPRPGLREISTAGAITDGPVSAVFFGIADDPTHQRIFYIQDKNLFAFPGDSGLGPATVVKFTGDMAVSPPSNGPGTLERLELNSYVTVAGNTTYEADATANTLTALTDAPGGNAVIEYQDQLYVAGVGPGNRVQYSDHADFNTWPDLNFFDVGYGWPISRFYKIQNGLLMSTQDDSWWLLQGSPETGSLRRIAYGAGPGTQNPRNALTAFNQVEMMVSTTSTTKPFPANFNGSTLDVSTFRHLRWLGTLDHIGGLWVPADNDLIFVGDGSHRALIRANGVWTFHTFNLPISEHVALFQINDVVLTVQGDGSHAPAFYRTLINTNRPAFDDDVWGHPNDGGNSGDPVLGTVEFKEEWDPSGDAYRPKAVIVDFVSYDNGRDPVTRNIDVGVRVINRFAQDGVGTTAVGSWSEYTTKLPNGDDLTPSSTTGTRRRYIFRPDNVAEAGGVQVYLQNIIGVKIEQVILDVEVVKGLERY